MIHEEQVLGEDDRIPVPQSLIEGFIADCRLRNFSQESIRTYKSYLQIMVDFLKQNTSSITELDRYDLRELLRYMKNERRVSSKTIDNYFSVLSTFCKFLIFEGYMDRNPVLPFRRRYLRQYKSNSSKNGSKRKLISVDEMSMLINSIINPRDKAIVMLLAKTGIRRGELVDIDLDDTEWGDQSIELKSTHKRTNLIVFFDDETAFVLRRWLKARENYNLEQDVDALFVGIHGGRLKRNGVYYAVRKHAQRVGLDDPDSNKMEDHFSPHCCRHWFTTHLRRSRMPREFIKELRGDSRKEAIDIYDHIDKKELRKSYIEHIPRLGIA